MGFYTTRWVEAHDVEEAKTKTLDAIKSEPALSEVPQGSGAKLKWEEIEIVDESDVPEIQGGFSFFLMEH